MANSINWGKIYESTYWGSGVADNTINWGKSYRDLAGDPALFITEWRTTTANETITIPIITSNNCTYTTSDGQSGTIIVGGSTTITFPIAGTHEVSISGDIQQIRFNNTGDKDKIYDIKQWGTDTTFTAITGAFYGCSKLDVTASDTPKLSLSSSRNMFGVFRDATLLEGTPVFNDWNVSAALYLNNMFQNTSFNQDIGNWDVGNVQGMVGMLRNTPFDQDISEWNIINVTDFTNFLANATLSTSNYDALLIGWEAALQLEYPNGVDYTPTINIHFGDSQYTAGGAAELARISLQDNYNWAITDGGIGAYTPDVFVTEWETTLSPQTITIPLVQSSTYTITTSEGDSAINFTGTNPTVTFPTAGTHQVIINGNVKQIQFNDTGDKEKILDVKQWGTDTTWTSFGSAFRGCYNLDVTANDIPTTNTTTFSSMFNGCASLIGTSAFNNWDVSNGTFMGQMFEGTTLFNQDISSWDMSNATSFANFFKDSSFNQDIGSWDVSSAENMGSLFNNTPFNQDISNWDVSNVTTLSNTFRDTPFNQDIGNWDVSNVDSMSRMFQDNTVFDQNLGDWNISNVTNFFNFLVNGTLSTSNYDALLNGWYSTLKAIYVDPASPPSYPGDGLSIHFGNSVSSSAGSASRTALQQSPFNWNLADGTP